MNLVGRCDEDNWLTLGSSSNPTSVIKKNIKKKQIKSKLRESQSFPTSAERIKSSSSKSKIKILKTKQDKTARYEIERKQSPCDSGRNSIRSAKVQLILERHRRHKDNNPKPFRINETMEDPRMKLKNLTNEERRQRNNSNMSVQPLQSSFLNFTIESGNLKGVERKFRINEQENTSEESEDESIKIESDYAKQDMVSVTENSTSTPVHEAHSYVYKRKQGQKLTMTDLSNKEDFYMSAPKQMVNSTTNKINRPPMNGRNENNSLSKNMPLHSNTSKLMQQLQQKKREGKVSLNKTMPNKAGEKQHIYIKPKNTPKIKEYQERPMTKKSPGSALSKYSKEVSRQCAETRNAVIMDNSSMQSKQFLTFQAPSDKKDRKLHKKNKSLGQKDNIKVPSLSKHIQSSQFQESVSSVDIQNLQSYYSTRDAPRITESNTMRSFGSSQSNLIDSFSKLTNRLISKQGR